MAALVLGLLAGSSMLAGQSRETLETRVTANGDIVVLKWGKKHPWAAELEARGAALMVEYRTRGGAVGTDCLPGSVAPVAASRRGRGPGECGLPGTPLPNEDRSLRFRLPEQLTAVPAGDVCLYFQLPSRRVLPIRRADEQGRETARFLYGAWAARARHRAELAALGERRDALRPHVAALVQSIARQDSTNVRSGWDSEPACEGIRAPQLERAVPTRPLAGPAERDGVARQVCVLRVANADRIVGRGAGSSDAKTAMLARLRSGMVHSAPLVDLLLTLLPDSSANDANLAQRRSQAAGFRRDWATWSPRIGAYVDALRSGNFREPHFGAISDVLTLQTITGVVGRFIAGEIDGGRPVPSAHVVGYVGGTLEAYDTCVADGKAQLETTFTTSIDHRARSPQLEEAARRQLVGACQAGVRTLAKLRADLAQAQRELAEVEAALSAGSGRADARSADRVELNNAACAP